MTHGDSASAGVLCRLAEVRDTEALAEIHVAAFEEHYRGVLADEILDSRTIDTRRRMWRDLLERPRPGHLITVAELEGEVVGFVTAEPSWYPDHDPAAVINLNRMYLRPGLEGAGVGGALYADQERRWKELGWTAVAGQIGEDNELSARFFQKRGWRFDGHARTAEDGSAERRIGKSLVDDESGSAKPA